MAATNSPTDVLIGGQDFVPVVLGGDRLGYGLARSFHMEYGYRTLIVSRMAGGPIAHSSLVVHESIPSLEDPEVLVPFLRELAPRVGSPKLLLLATTDHIVSVLARVKHRLDDLYLIPYSEPDVIDWITHKENFAQEAEKLGLPHPRTVVYDVADHGDQSSQLDGLTYPVIAKPSNAEAYAAVKFDGKKKVHSAASEAELRSLLDSLAAAGYRDKFIIQDVIPGDDQGMRILTCYVDKTGRVRFASYGRVLLEEHSPETLGIPAAIMTGADSEVTAQATRLLEDIGWRGYANFDLKYDPRTGRTVFFELNPRLGGTAYYMTAAGHNMTRAYVDEYVYERELSTGDYLETTNEHVFTTVPVRLLKHYVTDPQTRAKLQRLIEQKKVTNPWFYDVERDPRRWSWILMNQGNYVRKYRHYYPEPKALV